MSIKQKRMPILTDKHKRQETRDGKVKIRLNVTPEEAKVVDLDDFR